MFAKERKDNRNLVFRPIGLEMFVRLYVHFRQREKRPVLDRALKNLKWRSPGGVWDGTIWMHGRIVPKAKSAAFKYVL